MPIYSKTYERVNWKDYPDRSTSLDEQNLNKMDSAIDTLDDRIVALSGYADEAKNYADLSKSYAVGTNGEKRAEDVADNAKNYKELAESAKNSAVSAKEGAESAKTGAETASSSASQSASDAESYRDTTQSYMTTTEGYMSVTEGYKNSASQSANDAQSAKKDAESAKSSAENASDSASESASSALTTKGEVEQLKTDVVGLKSDVEGLKTATETASVNASASETNASTYATNASNSAEEARQYASQAAQGVPIATTTTLGKVKPDGTTITVDEDGTIHGASTYELPTASADTLGGIKVGQRLSISGGVLSADEQTITVDDEMSATSTNPVQNKVIYAEIDELKNSVSNGKTLVANAITDKGVATESTDSFQTMADNISQIETGGGELHGATISGTTSESTLYGQEVTLSKDDAVIQTATIEADGTFTFLDIEEVGTYKVTSTSTSGIPYEKNISITADNIINKDVLSINVVLLYVTIMGTTTESSLVGKTVGLYSGTSLIKQTIITSDSKFTFYIFDAGSYTIKSTDGTDEATADVDVTTSEISIKANKSVELSFLKIVTWANGTDAEIVKMLDAHYNGKINISDYWSVGDVRNVNLSAMGNSGIANYYGTTETHTAQTVQMVIIDFNHDDLTTSINGKTKAAITIHQKDCMKLESNSTFQYESNADRGNGAMNNYTGSHTNVGGWTSCSRRTWCNNSYKNALPSTLKNAVKTVRKLTSAGGQSSTINTTNDDIFLLSEVEIFGSTTYSYAGEGSQYSYFKQSTSNRYKNPKWSSASQSSALWWERSPYSSNSTGFCIVYTNGSADFGGSGLARGLAPVFCM